MNSVDKIKEKWERECEIHSIIFKDKKQPPMNNDKQFEWTDELVEQFFRFSKEDDSPKGSIQAIRKFKESKIKCPLLITEDGKQVYELDCIWYVCLIMWKGYGITLTIEALKFLNTGKNKIFSTRELCKEYILQNQPILSLNDLLSVWSKDTLYELPIDACKKSMLFQSFKKLAESKINNK